MTAERPAAEAYTVARRVLEQRLSAPLGSRRRELEARLTRERGRAQTYYAELIRELEARQAALPPDSPEQAALGSKRLPIKRERDGRLGELKAKYRLSAELSLLSVLRLYLPRVVFAGTLAAKRGDAPLAMTWDPVEHPGGGPSGARAAIASPTRWAFTAPAALPVRGASRAEIGPTQEPPRRPDRAGATRETACPPGTVDRTRRAALSRSIIPLG